MQQTEPPIGIIITWSQKMIVSNGGLRNFVRHFQACCRDEESGTWLHKSKNRPQFDISLVYIIIGNRIRYKLYYGGYQTGPTQVWRHDDTSRIIDWPRMVLAGPFERAPRKIPMRGFQGFRYIYEPIF